MLLTLRHEWRLKSTEKYALDTLSGVSWEFVFLLVFIAFWMSDCTFHGADLREEKA